MAVAHLEIKSTGTKLSKARPVMIIKHKCTTKTDEKKTMKKVQKTDYDETTDKGHTT